jgi:hypothetical protein
MIQLSPALSATKAPARPPTPLTSDSSSDDSDGGSISPHSSVTSSVEDGGSSSQGSRPTSPSKLEKLMKNLKGQMHSIEVASSALDMQVRNLCTKAKEADEFDWSTERLRPHTGALAAWLATAGLAAEPTLAEFVDAVLEAAESLDLATRIITLAEADAIVLMGGRRRFTVFELVAELPTLFEGARA